MILLLSLLVTASFATQADVTSFSVMSTSELDRISAQTQIDGLAEDLEENTNYFEHIKAQFDSAQTPTFQQVEGWISGRCVSNTNKKKLTPSMFFAEIVPVTLGSDKDGPLFPPQITNVRLVNQMVAGSENESADYFDSLDQYEIDYLNKLIKEDAELVSNGRYTHEITITNSELKSYYYGANSTSSRETLNAIRITKDFIVNHIVQTTTKIHPETRKSEKVVAELYCYFFKRLK